MYGRSHGLVFGQLRGLARDVFRLIQLADEGNGFAGYQRELHIGPVVAGGVVDNGPAFQQGLIAGAEQQAVARFPCGHGNNVAGAHLAGFGIGGIDIDALLVLRAGTGDGSEVIAELELQLRIGEPDGRGGGDIQVAEVARIGENCELLKFLAGLRGSHQAGGNDAASHFLLAKIQLHARAFQLIQHGAQGLTFLDLEGKGTQLFRERDAGIVAEAVHLARLAVDGERFQYIVHLFSAEIEAGRFARSQRARPLKVPNSVFIEHNGAYGQFSSRNQGCGRGNPGDAVSNLHTTIRRDGQSEGFHCNGGRRGR